MSSAIKSFLPYWRHKEIDMTKTTHITYLFDPLCGWCYGASATIKALTDQPRLKVHMMPTGLFANADAPRMDDAFAAYAWTADQRIARLTGQPFSEDYRNKVLADRDARLNSGPATLALTAVARTAPERELEALRAIQTARYVEGRDITATSVLVQILQNLTLTEAASQLQANNPDLIAANHARIKAAQVQMRRFGVDGVPVLLVDDGQNQRLITSNGIFGDKHIVAKLSGTASLAPAQPQN
jgi:putative protein-disulfide isomerase